MGRSVELTPEKKAAILAYSSVGLSTREIAFKTGFNQSTVSRLLKKYREKGNVDHEKGRGWKRASTAKQDRILKMLSLSDRRLSSTELKRDWEEMCNISVTSRNVRNRLLEAGFSARHPRRKPLLTKIM
ncbi:uncharacterized protein LOC124790022 [Schistocerca piceifrons]|uniref:uncharacterized protein LOC124790022 n=1 Tax=Schistocerca piceifrons TaxID=274613 RepID=UPI001F5F265F|nr:uncharacterized protein LOC124790022 [Schistocerca piceifrons]